MKKVYLDDLPPEPKKAPKTEMNREMDELAANIADDLVEDKPLDKEQAIAESIRLLGRFKNIDTLSEVEKDEIGALCAVNMMAKEFDVPVLSDLSNNFIKFRVSKTRKGRKGIEDILRSTMNERETLFGQMRQNLGNWVNR